MRKRIVAMALIPAKLERDSPLRADVRYAIYGRATWEWWCRRNGAEFVALDRPLGSGVYEDMSPSFRRWLAPQALIDEYGSDAQIALVDADTMIRWDAPNFFDVAGDGFAAVRDDNPRWICHDINAYQPLFPGVRLPWWEYFNAGVVVMGAAQLPTLAAFLDFVTARWAEVKAVHEAGRAGADQTPLNFILKREGEAITFMPPPFNLLRCAPMSPLLVALESGARTDVGPLLESLRSASDAFGFIEYAYVWHFTNVVRYRRLIMEEVWRRVSGHYPGAEIGAPADM